MRRLLLIVIDNAVKYTQEEEVAVRLLSVNGNAEIEVRDTGVRPQAQNCSRVT
jgi:signal transduction histidine kinase